MRVKKNGKVINLTERDIKILSKRLLREQHDKKTYGSPDIEDEPGMFSWPVKSPWLVLDLLGSSSFTKTLKKFYHLLPGSLSSDEFGEMMKRIEGGEKGKKGFTDEEIKEIGRLIQDEGLKSAQKYILSLNKSSNKYDYDDDRL